MSESPEGEKEYEPTQKRLDEAFDRGNFPKSTDLLGAISITLTALFIFYNSGSISNSINQLLLLHDRFDNGSAYSVYYLIQNIITLSLIAMAIPFVFLACSSLLLCRFRTPLSKLTPKMNRLSLISGFKSKFGIRSFKNALGMIAKLTIIALLLPLPLSRFHEIICIQCASDYSKIFFGLISFLATLTIAYLILGVLDHFLRSVWWRNNLKMSRFDFSKEQKDQEGDALLKNQRRRLAINMLGAGGSVVAVTKANVLIVNPTHYAVAVSWHRNSDSPPTVVAKGTDQMALLMREHALRHKVPQYRDPITARSIYSTIKVGKPIERYHYRAVASAIRFASAMKINSK